MPTKYPTPNNGLIIKWQSGKNEVFEWDENPYGSAGNGAHYHIRSLGDTHFYAGEAVPEPYATIYFGGQ